MISYSQTRGKERVKGIKAFVNFIEIFVNILDRTSEFYLLFSSEFGCGESIGDSS